MSNIKRLIRESSDLNANESLSLLSYYHNLSLVETLITTNYEDKSLISDLMDTIEKIKPQVSEIEDENKVKIFIKYLIVMYKNNIDLTKQYLSGKASSNVDEDKNNAVQSIWLNIDLIETFEKSFTSEYIESNEELLELVKKLDGQNKVKTLKMLLKKVLTFVPDFDKQDDELLQQQLDTYEDKEAADSEEEAPEFESDKEISAINHNASDLNLPVLPDTHATEPETALDLEDIALTRKTNIEQQESSDESDYNTSDISEIVTSQETIDKMVKLAKIGIQCLQYEDFNVAKDNFANLIEILNQELDKIEKN